MDELFDLNELLQVLMDLANEIEENYKQKLVESGHYTTDYALLDSIKTQVVNNDTGYEITMTLNDYWKWVENDTKPHFPPVDKIREWIQIKPIIPRPNSLGRKPTENQLAYLIGRKIYNEGTTGTHDLERTKDAVIPMYRERIAQALGHDVENYIRKVFKE